MNEPVFVFLWILSWHLHGDIYLCVRSLKNTVFRKREALLLRRVYSVLRVTGGTPDAYGA